MKPIPLPYTNANPWTMVIMQSHAPSTVPAMFSSNRLLKIADHAESGLSDDNAVWHILVLFLVLVFYVAVVVYHDIVVVHIFRVRVGV
jgi:hypothetical protein